MLNAISLQRLVGTIDDVFAGGKSQNSRDLFLYHGVNLHLGTEGNAGVTVWVKVSRRPANGGERISDVFSVCLSDIARMADSDNDMLVEVQLRCETFLNQFIDHTKSGHTADKESK